MRKLQSHTEAEARQELRSDEVLIPSGGNFYSAVSDEDFVPREHRLWHRRLKRKAKQERNWGHEPT